MAARDQRRARAVRSERAGRMDGVSQGAEANFISRVSKAAGGPGSEKVRVEQRADVPTPVVKQRASAKPGGKNTAASRSRQRSGGKQARPGRSSARPSPNGAAPLQPADS